MKKKTEVKTIKEIVPEMIKAVNATGFFLDMLNQIKQYTYRRNIKLTDEELEAHIEKQKLNILRANREYVMMFHFIQRQNKWPEWEIFRSQCHAELIRITPKEDLLDELEDDGQSGAEV